MANQAPDLIHLENVTFRYPGGSGPSLQDIDLTLRAGEMVLITGPTGCGKSTLLKVISGIIPLESSGRLAGRVEVDGLDTRRASLPELARRVGLVFQSPDDQLCATTVADEVAFGPRNLQLEPEEVDRRTRWALDQVGLSDRLQAQTARLSGGQKQRVAIAAQLAMEPAVLALDEPISQLDPQSAAEVLDCLAGLSRRGLTVVLVEHRLGECLEMASRLVVLDRGRLKLDQPARNVDRYLELMDGLGLKIPDGLLARRHWQVDSTRRLLRRLGGLRPPPDREPDPGPALMTLREIGFSYPEARQPALEDICLDIRQGEVLAVVGPNGSGKSTLLSLLAGLNRPRTGELRWRDKAVTRRLSAGRVGLLLQNPDLLLLETSLERELMSGPLLLGLPRPAKAARSLAAEMGLADCLDTPPWALSKGQRLRAALGAILAAQPEMLLLDEPTTGQNRINIHRLLSALRRRPEIAAMVLCSHDLETVARFADRVAVLQGGRLADLGPTRRVLAGLGRQKIEGLKPHWPLRTSLQLNIDPPFLTLDEMLTADGLTTGAADGEMRPACAHVC